MKRQVVGVAIIVSFAIFIPVAIVAPDFRANSQESEPPLYSEGQMLRLKLDGQKVQVVAVRLHGIKERRYVYDCRVGGSQQSTRDGFVSKDTEITRYKIVTFYDYELEPYPE